jgi:enoyl-CoA hydratase
MIELSPRGNVAVLTMAYGKANALDIEFCDAISTQFDTLRDTPERAVVLTGQGGMFSAGVNLLKLSDGGVDYVRRFLPALHRLYETIFFFGKPVIAAVNGHAIAGGCVLECCADKRIAAAGSARIGVTELLVGVPFPPMAFEVMRFATAPQYFADGMLNGATFTPDVALTRGLVDQVVEPSELLDRALAAAETLAALPPATFALTKQQFRQSAADAMERHGGRVAAASEEIWTSAITLDRVRDYVAKTLKKS